MISRNKKTIIITILVLSVFFALFFAYQIPSYSLRNSVRVFCLMLSLICLAIISTFKSERKNLVLNIILAIVAIFVMLLYMWR
jgi:hypothetical protein